ncbi:MAG: hypothetical protein PHZ25_02350 [Candidatus Pacebacteria bacterium]|nr:hypothetical protein [Candidatus Paceibacterota bacterium]
MNTITFSKNEWENIKSRLDNGKFVYTIRVDKELGKYNEGDVLRTEWGKEIKIISVKKINGGIDGLKSEYQFFNELTEKMMDELKDYDKMEIISLMEIIKNSKSAVENN